MEFNCLKYQTDKGITTITLNRPDRFNAFNNEMSFELQDALKAAKRDKETRVVVITGEGKAFCSGQDLKDIAGQDKRSFQIRYIKDIIRLSEPCVQCLSP